MPTRLRASISRTSSAISLAECARSPWLHCHAAPKMPQLHSIAAALGLALVMLGAIVFHIARKEYSQPAMNAILLLLALLIVIGSWKLAPIG